MTFSWAVAEAVLAHKKVRRQAWEQGVWMMIRMRDGTSRTCAAHMIVSLSGGKEFPPPVMVPYQFTLNDVAAQDWTST